MSMKIESHADQAGREKVLIHSYNVRHGDCTLIEYARDKVVLFRLLVDAGEYLPEALINHIKANRRGDSALDIDVVMLSHVDNDHQGGLPQLLRNNISIGEYLGPCLPAFRRLAWLFDDRVQRAINRAQEWEDMLVDGKIPVSYPFEGYTARFAEDRVVLSILSPASRLMEALALSNGSELTSLLMQAPLPVQWLLSSDLSDADNRSDDFSGLRDIFRKSYSASPDDFPASLPAPRLIDTDAIRDAYAAGNSSRHEPEFFGNHVLNDTSLIAVLDVHLGGSLRKRIVLTGDQENWSYVAAKHPVGLGVDVLKAPHHGGKLFIEGKSDSQAEVYTWLRPRTIIVSASGRHGLPELDFRNVARSVGATLLCPNIRRVESLAGGTPFGEGQSSCFQAFKCESSVERRPVTTLTLGSRDSTADTYACVQGLGEQVFAPIVVINQNVTSPSETLVRWTQGELEKHSNWIAQQLKRRHKEFLDRVGDSTNASQARLTHEPETWGSLSILARDEGRHALVADPTPVLRFGQRRRKFFATPSSWHVSGVPRIYRMPSEDDIAESIRWIRRIPKMYILADPELGSVHSGDAISVLNSCNWTMMTVFLALRTGLPKQVILEEIVPRLIPVLAQEFQGELCRAGRYASAFWESGKAVLYLRRQGDSSEHLDPAKWSENDFIVYERWPIRVFEELLEMGERDALVMHMADQNDRGEWVSASHMRDLKKPGAGLVRTTFAAALTNDLKQAHWTEVWP